MTGKLPCCLSILILLLTTSLLPAQETWLLDEATHRYSMKEHPVSIVCPADFEQRSGFMASEFLVEFYSTAKSAEFITTNIKLGASAYEHADLEDYFLENVKGMFASKNYTAVDTGTKASPKGLPIKWAHTRYTLYGIEGESIQYYYFIEGKGYMVTCNSSAEEYGKYEGVFEKTALSVRKP